MSSLFVLAEHRRGELRDITWEILSKGRDLAESQGLSLTSVLLGHGVGSLADDLTAGAGEVIVVEDERLKEFNSDTYQDLLSRLVRERKPSVLLMGHTAYGMDLAPSLAAELDAPLVTDCVDLVFEEGELVATRQLYGGKVNARVVCRPSETYVATIRSGVFSEDERPSSGGRVVPLDIPLEEDTGYKRFIGYLESEAGEVDITQSDVIVAVGRGIKDAENMEIVEDLARAAGGVLACSRPVVDKKWLPKDRQVGTSGKTVKPKLYIAVGISGTFQHLVGLKGAGTVVAINRDPKAPFFNVADYGIVDDLFKVVPVLSEKIREIRQRP